MHIYIFYLHRARLTPPDSLVMSCLLKTFSFRDARSTHFANNNTNTSCGEGAEATSSFGTRVDWVLLPCVETCLAHKTPFAVTVSSSRRAEDTSASALTNCHGEESDEGYRVVPAISARLTDHNLVMASLKFTLC